MAKIIISLILILILGFANGGADTVSTNSDECGASNRGDSLSSHMKAVDQFCEPTKYKCSCIKTLSSVYSTDPKEFINVSILAILHALNESFDTLNNLVGQVSSDSSDRRAIEYCRESLDEAVQELQDTFSMVVDSDLNMIVARSNDFRTWLGSIISYQEMCLDGFEDNSSVKAILRNSTNFGSQLTDNVLNILGEIANVLDSFGLQLNINTSHRLLQDNGYPTWMSAVDRNLLASNSIGRIKPNVVVAQDGSSQYKTIQAAVDAYPKNHKGRYVIYIKAGTYQEYVTISTKMKNIYMYGDGSNKTIITGNRSSDKDALHTWKTATVGVDADGFIAKDLAFINTAGPERHQAVAIRVKSDMSAFYNVRFDSFQDTLFYQNFRQFYRDCVISGTVDFIFGHGQAVIQNSLIIVKRPLDNQFITVTADGRKKAGKPGGVIIHNCTIIPEDKLVPDRFKFKTYLGRPWKKYSTTVVMESQLGDFIQAEGWMSWPGESFHDTLYYAEYNNEGPGAKTDVRVKWKTLHFLNENEAAKFTPGCFLKGQSWIPNTGVPVLMGLKD